MPSRESRAAAPHRPFHGSTPISPCHRPSCPAAVSSVRIPSVKGYINCLLMDLSNKRHLSFKRWYPWRLRNKRSRDSPKKSRWGLPKAAASTARRRRPSKCTPPEVAQSSRTSWCNSVHPVRSLSAAQSPLSQCHGLPARGATRILHSPRRRLAGRSRSRRLQARIKRMWEREARKENERLGQGDEWLLCKVG
jgi:hypothetical protein